MKQIVVICCLLLLSACVTKPPAPVLTACKDKRPKVCTQEYQPVCGFNEAGQKMRTYSNACSACGDVTVLGYTLGQCK
jgi:hypothetical protein